MVLIIICCGAVDAAAAAIACDCYSVGRFFGYIAVYGRTKFAFDDLSRLFVSATLFLCPLCSAAAGSMAHGVLATVFMIGVVIEVGPFFSPPQWNVCVCVCNFCAFFYFVRKPYFDDMRLHYLRMR